MSAHCDYIDAQCEFGDDFNTCVKQKAVSCHNRRENEAAKKAAKEKEGNEVPDL